LGLRGQPVQPGLLAHKAFREYREFRVSVAQQAQQARPAHRAIPVSRLIFRELFLLTQIFRLTRNRVTHGSCCRMASSIFGMQRAFLQMVRVFLSKGRKAFKARLGLLAWLAQPGRREFLAWLAQRVPLAQRDRLAHKGFKESRARRATPGAGSLGVALSLEPTLMRSMMLFRFLVRRMCV
jgi:hypothetical protein